MTVKELVKETLWQFNKLPALEKISMLLYLCGGLAHALVFLATVVFAWKFEKNVAIMLCLFAGLIFTKPYKSA